MTIGIVFDASFYNHEAPYEHPECPQRLDAVVAGLQNGSIYSGAAILSPREATLEELCTVHSPLYIERMLTQIEGREGNLDADTFFSTGSREAALKAAGGAAELARQVHDRTWEWGMAVVRPPGHHAESDRACGFCLINNVAVAAGVLLKEQRAHRVAIVDWDVHHGNGTQQQFIDRDDVLYISLHQWPHFPGSGLSSEIGTGKGVGRTVNVPFPARMGDAEYMDAFERLVIPVLQAFRPEHILVSAGFDAHRLDPLSGMQLSTNGFQYMTWQLQQVAQSCCGGRISFYLEGGYHLGALADSVTALCHGMRGDYPDQKSGNPSAAGASVVNSTIAAISPFWNQIL